MLKNGEACGFLDSSKHSKQRLSVFSVVYEVKAERTFLTIYPPSKINKRRKADMAWISLVVRIPLVRQDIVGSPYVNKEPFTAKAISKETNL